MTNSKSTKRALVTSALAILMCVTMLIGTTFAWFTDTASTGVNKIQAGNLDVELSYKNNSTNGVFKTADKETSVFNNEALWEPGHVEYVVLKVSNAGTLALKYKLGINIAEEVGSTNVDGKRFKLSDYIRFAVLEGDKTEGDMDRDDLVAAAGVGAALKGYSVEEHLAKTEEKIVTLVVWMPTTVGNEANHQTGAEAPFIRFGISVAATQDTVEKDSFDEQYDKNAQYPEVAYVAVSAPTADDIDAGVNPLANALISAAAEKDAITGEAKQKIVADLTAGNYTLTDKENESRTATAGKEITLIGAGKEDTTFFVEKVGNGGENNATYCFDGAKSVVLKDMTIKFNSGNYRGFNRVGNIRLENCTIVGMASEWATGDVEFIKCDFVFAEDYNQYTNSLWTRTGSSFTFTDCTFTSENGKFINVYREGNNGVVDVTLNNCKFINKAPAANKAAVNIKSQFAWNVTINKCITEGQFPTENSGLWQSKPDNGAAVAEGNKVTVNP